MGAPSRWFARLARRPGSPATLLRASLLVLACAATLVSALLAIGRHAESSRAITNLNRAASDRLARYGRMNQLTLGISAPCNEVFDSGDLDGETARSRIARLAFGAQLDSARLEVAVRGDRASGLILTDLAAVKTAADLLMNDVDLTFAGFRDGSPPEVAVIDGHLAGVQAALHRLGQDARAAHAASSRALLDEAAAFQTLAITWMLAFASVAIVIAWWRPRRAAAMAIEPAIVAAAPVAATPLGDAQLRLILDSAPDPAVTLDEAGHITGWNIHAERVFGRSFEEVRGTRLSAAVIAARDRDSVDRGLVTLTEAASGVQDLRLDVLAIDYDGREFAAELAIAPAQAGETTAFTAFLRDATDRRRGEAELRRLSGIVGQLASGLVVIDALGRVEWASQAFGRLTGHAAEELKGQALDASLRCSRTDQHSIDRMVQSLRAGTAFCIELAHDRHDGQPGWIEIDAEPIEGDPERAGSFLAVVTDASDRKHMEATLRDAEARHRGLLDAAGDGTLTIDDTGALVAASPGCERVFGYSPGELIGRRAVELVRDIVGPRPATSRERGAAAFTLATGPAREHQGVRRNGTTFPIELALVDTRHDGRRAWTGVVRDLTASRGAEALRDGQRRVLELIAKAAPLERSLTELVRVVERQQPGVTCMVLLSTGVPSRPRIIAAPSVTAELSRAIEAIETGPSTLTWGAATCLKTRVMVDDTAAHPLWAEFRELALAHGLRSSWAEPILSPTGQTLGAFVSFRRRVHMPDATELLLVGSAGHLAAITIERARATERRVEVAPAAPAFEPIAALTPTSYGW